MAVKGFIIDIKIIPNKIDITLGTKITDKLDIPDIFIAVTSSLFFIFRKNQIPDIKIINGSMSCNKEGTFKDVNSIGI